MVLLNGFFPLNDFFLARKSGWIIARKVKLPEDSQLWAFFANPKNKTKMVSEQVKPNKDHHFGSSFPEKPECFRPVPNRNG